MAASGSGETLCSEKSSLTNDWIVVLPRRGKKSRAPRKSMIVELREEEQPWAPVEVETDPERESKLMQKMQVCIQKLEKSEFCRSFFKDMQEKNLLDRFHKVLGSETKMQMVIYGIGSIELYEPPRLQLSLAILMKTKFDWIGDVEVFDPIISATEFKVLTSLGCSVLTVNEQGRRRVSKPSIFFMAHCEAELYDNLLETNWDADHLSEMVIFGNSFTAYEQHVSVFKSPSLEKSRKHILAARNFTEEFGVSILGDDYFRAFHGTSWHFLSPLTKADLDIE